MKKSIVTIFLMFFIFFSVDSSAIMKKGQKLACEAFMCAIGVAIPESHHECVKKLVKWDLYLATLGPFGTKPKCPKKDEDENVIGYADVECHRITDPIYRNKCEEAERKRKGGGIINRCEGLPPHLEIECQLEECRRSRPGEPDRICQIR